jgi:hypothetical protein
MRFGKVQHTDRLLARNTFEIIKKPIEHLTRCEAIENSGYGNARPIEARLAVHTLDINPDQPE